MKIVTFMGRKGGITKTTLAINMAAACTRAGLRTVLVDADGQGNASAIVGITPHDGFYDLLLGDMEFQDVLRPVPQEFHGSDTEMLIISSWVNHRELESNKDVPGLIYDRFGELTGWADVAIVDTAPSTTEVHAGFYYRSDYILLPTLPDFPSILSLHSTLVYLQAAKEAGEQAGFPAAQIMGIVPNRFSMKEGVDRENYGYVKGKYDSYNVFPFLRNLTVWKQATQFRRSIYNLPDGADYNSRVQARAAIMEFQPVVESVLQAVSQVVS